MKTRIFLFALSATILVGCGSPSNPGEARDVSNSANSKTNVNSANSTPYLRTENAYTVASNSELGSLAPSGKAATEIVGKTATEFNIWQNKKVAPRLRKLMGSDYARMRNAWNTETPIRKFGDFLMMTGCQKNNCDGNMYVIFMNMATGDINVIHIEKGEPTLWKSYDEISLPPPFLDELARMKLNGKNAK